MSNSHYHAVIMAGGGGTRLWPLSRQHKPKQSLPLLGERTMFQISVQRLAPLFPPERIWVVTAEHYAKDLQAQCPEVPAANYVLEPAPRGTAPAIGLAALALQQRDPEAVMACLTADHHIGNEAGFRAVLAAAGLVAEQGRLVTLGIAPTFAATGFGYIQRGADLGQFGGLAAYEVVRFKEKPAPAEAETLWQDGHHSWNSGMFIWRAAQYLAEVQRQLPALHGALQLIATNPANLAEVWATVPNVTVDYGIMEHANQVVVIPAQGLAWNDIGSWDALFDVLPADKAGNVVVGAPLLEVQTHNTLVHAAQGRSLVVTLGVNDLIVVDTGDVLFICSRAEAQNVRQVVAALKEQGREAYL